MSATSSYDERRQTLSLYDQLDREAQSESTLPERKEQIAVTLRRLERDYLGPVDQQVDFRELRDRMRAEVMRVKIPPTS